ncbi:MAG: DNA-3-methyladenine glycosylase [Flavobacteriales bacterium]
MNKLPRSFYLRDDVVAVARELLGKKLVSTIGGERTVGIITETEAYAGQLDKASHAYGGRRTARNEMLYARGGTSYVYLCYGIHHLFNVVTHAAGIPHAVLIRAIHPVEGSDLMHRRRGGTRLTTGGPGTLTQALGIRTTHNGTDLLGDIIYIEDGPAPDPGIVISGPRIGVDYAGEDALLPYRFHFDPLRSS